MSKQHEMIDPVNGDVYVLHGNHWIKKDDPQKELTKEEADKMKESQLSLFDPMDAGE